MISRPACPHQESGDMHSGEPAHGDGPSSTGIDEDGSVSPAAKRRRTAGDDDLRQRREQRARQRPRGGPPEDQGLRRDRGCKRRQGLGPADEAGAPPCVRPRHGGRDPGAESQGGGDPAPKDPLNPRPVSVGRRSTGDVREGGHGSSGIGDAMAPDAPELADHDDGPRPEPRPLGQGAAAASATVGDAAVAREDPRDVARRHDGGGHGLGHRWCGGRGRSGRAGSAAAPPSRSSRREAAATGGSAVDEGGTPSLWTASQPSEPMCFRSRQELVAALRERRETAWQEERTLPARDDGVGARSGATRGPSASGCTQPDPLAAARNAVYSAAAGRAPAVSERGWCEPANNAVVGSAMCSTAADTLGAVSGTPSHPVLLHFPAAVEYDGGNSCMSNGCSRTANLGHCSDASGATTSGTATGPARRRLRGKQRAPETGKPSISAGAKQRPTVLPATVGEAAVGRPPETDR